ncbi:hypothetical protein DSECCO2_618970 [anaerobic digester metagenome]
MNAIEAQTAAVIIRMIGLTPTLMAVAAMIGIKTAAMAVFEVISVASETARASTRTRTMIGSPWMRVRDSTIVVASPL